MPNRDPGRRRPGSKAKSPETAPENPAGEVDVVRASRRSELGEGTRHPVTGWAIFVAIVIVVAFLYLVRTILLPFVFAAAFAFVVTPLVDRLAGAVRFLPRWGAAVVVYIVLMVILGGLGYWAGTLLVADISQLSRSAPQVVQRTIGALIGNNVDLLGKHLDAKEISTEIVNSAKDFILSGQGAYIATVGVTAVFGVFLGAVLVLYFLISGERLVNGALWLVPPEYRPEVASMTRKVGPLLWRYLVGLCVVVTYTATMGWIGFGAIFHLSHAVLLAIVVGVLELIPIVGPLTSAMLVGIAAMQESSLWAAAGLAAFAVMLRLSIDQFVGPLVLGKAASVHPVVIIFCFLSGAVVFGIIGLVLAVPVAATIRLVLNYYYAEPVEE